MKTKITLLFAILFSFASNAQNSLEITSAPNIMGPGEGVNVYVNFTKEVSGPVYIQLRQLSPNKDVIKEVKVMRNTSSGEINFQFYTNAFYSGSDNIWHVQMYNSDWTRKLAESYGPKLTISAGPSTASYNSISVFYPPEKASAGSTEVIKFLFSKKYSGKAIYQARLLSKSGKVWAQNTVSNSDGTGGLSIPVNIPSNIPSGTDYKWNVQMYDSNWKTVLATITKEGKEIVGKRTNMKAKTLIVSNNSQEEILNDFTVSPNPFVNSFEYEYSVEDYDDVTVDLYALNGRKIKTLKSKESHRPGNYNDVVDTSDLDAGIYILRINTSEGEKAIKLIKN
ncbi:T9SS type A sorting domain-containing protein [Zobellia nedashkovskayae]